MKLFKWRLQRVLDIRKKEEEVKRAELLGITEHLAQRRTELLMKKRALKIQLAKLKSLDSHERIVSQENFLRFSANDDKLIKNLMLTIDNLKKLQQEKIAEILKIKQYKEGLEKLREEAKIEFIKDQEKLDQKNSDEISGMSFARKVMAKNSDHALSEI
jgi:flagellar FliJ protein